MRKILPFVAAIGCIAVLSTVANAQCGTLFGECLINGNLDIGTAGDGTDPGTAPPWTLTNAGNDTAAQFQPGFADSTGGNGLWYRAFLGSEETPVSADLAQTVVVPTAGQYRLTFDFLVEEFFTASSAVATLSSSSGPIDTLDLLAAPRVDAGGGFNAHPPEVGVLEISGVNVGDTLTVSVAMVDGVAGQSNPQSMVVDNFSLARVPEPASALLVLMGVAGMLGLARRRR